MTNANAPSIRLKTPLGEDNLLLRSMVMIDRLSRPFEMHLVLLSTDYNLDFDKLLGQNVGVRVALRAGETRHFNGLVAQMSFAGSSGKYAMYNAVLRPWLWFLSRSGDCRIFQQKSVPDIVKEVFGDHEFTDLERRLFRTYQPREYCVQYRESDLNFVSRLLEEEGIYYYFTHEANKHKLILCDSVSGHEKAAGYEELRYFPEGDVSSFERESISEWLQTREVRTGVYECTDYDFEKPKASLEVRSSKPEAYEHATLTVFDYHPCDYQETTQGEFYASIRREELQSKVERFRGQGNPRGLGIGHLFKLKDHPRDSYNREYLVVAITHTLQSVEYEMGSLQDQPSYRLWSELEVTDSQRPFRPPRVTPKAFVRGPQTAVVVGPPGEEIYTDKYGRVKLKFRWDHLNPKDDESCSCWIRVSSAWAGKRWGQITIPRIGQEVVVDFLEGDPDQPLVVGRLYNADQMPPYDLPGNKTQSGTKSRSSLGGTDANFNEIRFEDQIGSEQLYIHAEKDQDGVVENDETLSVGRNRSVTVGANELKFVRLMRTHTVGINEAIAIGAAQENVIGTVRLTTIGIDDHLNIGKNLVIDAGDSIIIKTGASSITMKKDGTIYIKGKDITIQGSGKIAAKASDDVIIRGCKVGVN